MSSNHAPAEALFTLGDRPETRWEDARRELREMGYDSTISYLADCCRSVYSSVLLSRFVSVTASAPEPIPVPVFLCVYTSTHVCVQILRMRRLEKYFIASVKSYLISFPFGICALASPYSPALLRLFCLHVQVGEAVLASLYFCILRIFLLLCV